MINLKNVSFGYPKNKPLFESLVLQLERGNIYGLWFGKKCQADRDIIRTKEKKLLSFDLAYNSKLLILDEPTNGLDIPSKSQFRKLLAKTISEKRTFIISTHQVREMENRFMR